MNRAHWKATTSAAHTVTVNSLIESNKQTYWLGYGKEYTTRSLEQTDKTLKLKPAGQTLFDTLFIYLVNILKLAGFASCCRVVLIHKHNHTLYSTCDSSPEEISKMKPCALFANSSLTKGDSFNSSRSCLTLDCRLNHIACQYSVLKRERKREENRTCRSPQNPSHQSPRHNYDQTGS
jgi:hypothetical protein